MPRGRLALGCLLLTLSVFLTTAQRPHPRRHLVLSGRPRYVSFPPIPHCLK